MAPTTVRTALDHYVFLRALAQRQFKLLARRIDDHGDSAITPAAQLHALGPDASAVRHIVTYGTSATWTRAPGFGQRGIEQVDAHIHLFMLRRVSV